MHALLIRPLKRHVQQTELRKGDGPLSADCLVQCLEDGNASYEPSDADRTMKEQVRQLCGIAVEERPGT